MGKFRKGKKSSGRLQRPGRSEKGDEQIKNDKILPLIAKLKSADFRDRVVAMSAVNAMIDDPHLRELLLREKLLQVIMSHSLSDQSQEIVAEGFGLLRNVVIEEGRDSAVYLFRQNILTTIKATIERLNNVWQETQQLSTLKGQDKVIVREFIENVLGLICGLALADDQIYDAIIELMEPLAPFLSQLLQAKFTLITDVVLELIYILSEDQDAVASIVNSGLNTVVAATESQNSASQVYKIGIDYNLIEINHNGTETDLARLIEALYNTISCVDFSVQVPPTVEITDPKKLKESVIEAARVRSQINATQVAFEILASIMVSSSHLQSPSQDYLGFLGDKVAPVCISALGFTNYTLRASSTLNNIGWTFNLLELDWKPLAENLWTSAAPIALETKDINLLTSLLGLLGSIAQLLEGHVPLPAQDLQKLSETISSMRPAEINLAFEDTKEFIHLLRAYIPLICRIGAVDFETCQLAATSIGSLLDSPKTYGPGIIAECINGLFELFGDNTSPTNQIYSQYNINEKLQALRPELKRVLKSVDKNDAALKEQCDETLLNMDRFIEYKTTQEP